MNQDQARHSIIEALAAVAPEIDPGGIDDEQDLTEQLDIDSMDYLNWLLEIHTMTGVDIPERDYPQLMTVAAAIKYLVAASS